MAKKQNRKNETSMPVTSPVRYQIINRTAKMFPVPYYAESGEVKYLNLRLQKRRNGQRPPVLPDKAITPGIRRLEQKGWIALRKL